MNWDQIATGERCPFDRPRTEPNDYWETIVRLSVSTLCLTRNQGYRGHCILIFDPRHAVRPDELTSAEWIAFSSDAHKAVCALIAECKPDHINVECLGNSMPHLHWQLIPRYRDDPRWGGPIWTTMREELHEATLSGTERAELIDALRRRLA